MSTASHSRKKRTLSAEFGQYAALYLTIAAFAIVTLISQSETWPASRWMLYLIGVVLFALLADRTTRCENSALRQVLLLLIGQMALLVVLTVLSDYYFLTMMLSLCTVSLAQSNLSKRQAISFDVILLVIIALTASIGLNPSAGLQILLALGAGFIFIVVFTRLAQSERHAREQLEKANTQLAEYAAQVAQLATIRERNRLAREVHDTLGHYLTVINVQLEVVNKLIDSNPPRAKEAAAKAKELASEGLSEVRRSVAALRPSPLDDRLLPDAIRSLTSTAREAGLLVSFEQAGIARSISPEIETVLYRAAQEALTNIRKHAHASAANVRLAYEPDAVRLQVRDNGIGRKNDEDNVGLSALRERAAALNGTVAAENHPDGGFVLDVMLPLDGDVSHQETSH